MSRSAGIAGEDSWRVFRWLRGLTIGLWLGWLPFGVLVVDRLQFAAAERLAIALLLVYVASFLTAGLLLTRWPCPRCHKSFVWNPRHRRRSLWPTTCAHCDLRVGSTDFTARSA